VARHDLDVRRFGPGAEASVERWRPTITGATVRFRVRGKTLDLDLSVRARHQAANALAALLAFEALGFPLDAARDGARAVELSQWRGEEAELPGGGLLINDCYNANPASMRAALEHLAERAGARRRVAVLGEMAELGEAAAMLHREVGEFARSHVDALIAVGELGHEYLGPAQATSAWAPDAEAAIELLRARLEPGDAVLVKASRSLGLERVAEALVAVTA
jgi:UDP-N-acetylmuramoyl-tripeptide--D-alanyl-D-alanine ligase